MKEFIRIHRKRSLPVLLCLLLCLSCGKAQPADAPASSAEPTAQTVSEPSVSVSTASLPESGVTEAETPNVTAVEETPTPEPTLKPVSDEQLDEGYLDAWFDDSVMIGDSIVAGLGRYVTGERNKDRPCLGKMRIVGVSGLTLRIALAAEQKKTNGALIFRSRFMTVSEVVEATQAKRLFILVGVRDRQSYSEGELIAAYDAFISAILENHPDLRIYVHSITPTLKEFAMSVRQTADMNRSVNERLRAFCEEKGYTYLELADLIRDDEGYLKFEYSGKDYSFHPNDTARAIWVKLLRSCARDEYYAGIWKPEEPVND